MRRTPTFIWIPFVFSIGTISWVLLIAGLVLISAVIITPAMQEVREAEAKRNDYEATLAMLDQKIAMNKEFIDRTPTDALLQERLAALQLNLNRADQQPLIVARDIAVEKKKLDDLMSYRKNLRMPGTDGRMVKVSSENLEKLIQKQQERVEILEELATPKDRSVETLLAQSLTAPPVKPVEPLPTPLAATLVPGARQLLVLIACALMGLSFFLGVKYERN
jgi:hypothetical protein